MKPLSFFLAILFFLITFSSCNKSADNNPAPVDSLPHVDTTAWTNNWECTIDGNTYSGAIDTSFLAMVFGASSTDSVVISTGTSFDKKAHIHFKFSVNRTGFPASGVDNSSNTFLVFDTAANNLFLGNIWSQGGTVTYKIDTVSGTHLSVSFSGTLNDQKSQMHTVKGKFSCSLFQGNNEPNKFYCLLDSVKRYGYFTSASLNANTLIMEGVDYFDYPLNEFRIIVRTGGTKPGTTYTSSSGDVGFNSIPPNSFSDYFYVDDSIGTMTVSINSVEGNTVRGSFSGETKAGKRIDTGSFVCKVANYVPQAITNNRWAFSAWIDPSFGVYQCYAGNITSVTKTSSAGRNYLTINGESDNESSAFKIIVSSTSQIHAWPYVLDGYPDNVLDSFYFKSSVHTWDGTIPYLYADASTANAYAVTCTIDTLTSNRVVGRLTGHVKNNLDDFHFQSSGPREIREARFSANF